MTIDKKLKELKAYVDAQIAAMPCRGFAHRRAIRELTAVSVKLNEILSQSGPVEDLTPDAPKEEPAPETPPEAPEKTPTMTRAEAAAKARAAKAAKAKVE